ncbi:MAG: thioesterase family protein [Myxococcota bacterium]|nr:acyl-CoA thioesterase [Myxococcales bacterium]
MGAELAGPPDGAAVARVAHRVAFFETDGMRIVHHANYVRWFELARIEWMDRYHVPYTRYVDAGLHLATIRLEVDYRAPARFDDRVEIATWLDHVAGASLRMAYCAELAGRVLVTGATEHACVDEAGRPRRIPREWRDELRTRAAPDARDA